MNDSRYIMRVVNSYQEESIERSKKPGVGGPNAPKKDIDKIPPPPQPPLKPSPGK